MQLRRKYFAYKHVNGSIHLKRYTDSRYEGAMESDFCEEVTAVFFAADDRQAMHKAKAVLA